VSSIEVRPFHRADRDQLTDLVNAHVSAVVPGVSVSVNAVLSQLEREPGEFIVDPWVDERATLVAEQRGRVVAAAHLLRYGAGTRVGDAYRDAGEIRWLLFWPAAPYWPDSGEAAEVLMAACLARLAGWRAAHRYADGTLPAPGVYGVPEQWPHVAALYERAGFVHSGRTEVVYLADVAELPRAKTAPVDGLGVRREVGINGTRLSAVLGTEIVGYIEVDSRADGGRVPRHGGLADIGNLHVTDGYRRRGIGTWLVGEAAYWLRLARVDRLLDYAGLDDAEYRAFLATLPFHELTRTRRGWEHALGRL
jgi:ribosomal protein S18 acetylase RimI-like enzyme